MARLRTLTPARAAVLAALVAFSSGSRAQAPAQNAQVVPDRVDARSPRLAIREFLRLARRGDFADAAVYLGRDIAASDSGAALARRLNTVLDQRVFIDERLISPIAAGNTADGLPPNVEQIGTVPNDIGVREPVQMRRLPDGAEPAWVFSAQTVLRISVWHAALGENWLRSNMPESLRVPGPLGIERWQWVVLAVLVPIALLFGWLLGRATVAVARRAVRRTQTLLDDRVLEQTAAPIHGLWAVIAYRALLEPVELSIYAMSAVDLIVRSSTALIVTWLMVRVTYAIESDLPASRWAEDRAEMRALVPLLGRVSRIFLVAIGIIAFVSQFGYKVTTLLTTLGIGGIAVALAAQKTLEHVFGSVAIGVDQPIRVGDWVRVDGREGEVEVIGLRSTRIRTLDRTVVVIPNGRLADMQMENFGVRDRILLRTQLALKFGTTVAQLRRVRDDVEKLLKDHPLVWPDKIIVRFRAFTPSLEIDVMAWIATTDFDIFRAAREEILFRILEIVQNAGTDFSAATHSLQVFNRGGSSDP
jgi:MscS family membrane protein